MVINEMDFEQVYTEFQPRIYRYLVRLIGIKEAEDITQDVFVKIGKALATFNNQSQLSTWIYQIATNAAIDRMRSRSFKQESTESYCLIEAEQCKEIGCSYKKPSLTEEKVIRKEMNECIQGYIAILPESYRTAIILSEIEGLKNSEIASILGLSIGTVKIRLHRGKEKLKELLSANCTFYRTECNELACESKGPNVIRIKPFTSMKH
ncbi:sigma-70 family RNA polymerase sigma factor [Pelosinus sp. IPA-1]|uniref:RNA polymerase sigma factor n=1 Tax=Pelosinus sp. IPA-1 TaxID=3029569 RepID=UPI00243624F5|nr:sigma-70 family RNA polymerase sigma factor [Pelosinus sp. IPA-1]GMA99135.1 RNA polymerase sigma factor [Pelosinus sp. IPA-1]